MFGVEAFLEPEMYFLVLWMFVFATSDVSWCAMSRYCKNTPPPWRETLLWKPGSDLGTLNPPTSIQCSLGWKIPLEPRGGENQCCMPHLPAFEVAGRPRSLVFCCAWDVSSASHPNLSDPSLCPAVLQGQPSAGPGLGNPTSCGGKEGGGGRWAG